MDRMRNYRKYKLKSGYIQKFMDMWYPEWITFRFTENTSMCKTKGTCRVIFEKGRVRTKMFQPAIDKKFSDFVCSVNMDTTHYELSELKSKFKNKMMNIAYYDVDDESPDWYIYEIINRFNSFIDSISTMYEDEY
ncbi:MAG: hypothetical protein ACRCX2_16690 [Paraclostridium sp.]